MQRSNGYFPADEAAIAMCWRAYHGHGADTHDHFDGSTLIAQEKSLDSNAVQMLLDRIEIEKLAFLFGQGNDVSSSFFDLCLTDDVEVVYPFGRWQGLDEQKRHRDASIGKTFAYTQSFMTNLVIEIDGDTAKLQCQIFAAHGKKAPEDKDVIFSGGIYTQDCIRTPQGWRIKRHDCKAIWRSTNPALLVTYR